MNTLNLIYVRGFFIDFYFSLLLLVNFYDFQKLQDISKHFNQSLENLREYIQFKFMEFSTNFNNFKEYEEIIKISKNFKRLNKFRGIMSNVK